MNKERLNKEINCIIQSGINNEKINSSPYFTTRIMGKVEQMEVKPAFNFSSYILKPAFVLLLLVNIANFYFFNGQQQDNSDNTNDTELATSDYIYASNDFIINEDLISNSVE